MEPIAAIDLILIDRAKEGDRDATQKILEKHRACIYRYALKLTKNIDDANDLLAESLARAARGLIRFQRDSSLTTWLFRITKNCFLDSLRKPDRKYQVSIEQVFQSGNEVISRSIWEQSECSEDTLLDQASLSELIGVIDKLRKHESYLIKMYVLEQNTYADISKKLDIPVGTVKSRINRARLNLKELLTRDVVH